MTLSHKEIRIVLLIAEGTTSAEIAKKLDISIETVSNHRKRILGRSGCRNWNHFMASHGRSGQIDRWVELYSLHELHVLHDAVKEK